MKNPLLIVAGLSVAGLLAFAYPVSAHTPVCDCYGNKDNTITCEGGFSDGSSAEGIPIKVLDSRERILVEAKMDKKGTFTFPKPEQEFHVVFDAGGGHLVTVYSDDIE